MTCPVRFPKLMTFQVLPNSLRAYGFRELRPWYARFTIPKRLKARLEGYGTNSSLDIFVDNVHIELSLWDTAGQEEFDRLRSLSYDDTHAIMLCFSVDSRDSLENVESKWVGEIAENCQGVKLVLIALKCDLRENNDEEEAEAEGPDGAHREKKQMINYSQGLEVARRIGALRYLECSAMRNRGVNEAFTEAARVALSVKGIGGKDESRCALM
jgi:Rho family protein